MSIHDLKAASIPFLSLSGDNETRFASPTIIELPPIPQTPRFQAVLASATIAVIAARFSWRLWLSFIQLRAFDGPRAAIVSNWWYFRRLIGGRQHIEFHKAAQKYGRRLNLIFSHNRTISDNRLNREVYPNWPQPFNHFRCRLPSFYVWYTEPISTTKITDGMSNTA